MERLSLDSILFLYVVDGSFSFISEGAEYTAYAGETALVDCFAPHAYFTSGGFEAYWVHVNGCNIYELYNALNERYGKVIGCNESAASEIIGIFSAVKNNIPVSDSVMSFKIYRYITSLFDSVNREGGENRISAMRFITENYSEKLTVADIAAQVHLSPSQFSRIFKKSAGISPYEYLLNIRLAKAKELLKNTELSVGGIAYKTGFSGESNFIYFFKRREGISPLKFRKILY